jgi:hypothetical protein
MPIERSDGVTLSERYLNKLCDRTFLSLWSYPGVYSNEGLARNGQGKEVCDLLVIFENNILLFSDKDCQFPNSGNLAVDWNRWFKKSIKKSVQQLWGAEKWIRRYPEQLFLDKFCEQPFPLYLPNIKTAKFHLIAVAHNSSERCRHELGGNGNLRIQTFKRETSNYSSSEHCSQFCIEDIDPNQTFVHILDDISLDTVLDTLNTVSDLVAYLSKKEKLFRSGLQISAASELEILAYYHKFINEHQERDFLILHNLDEQQELTLNEGYWQEFEQSYERKSKLEADIISYQWDKIIERFIHYCFKEEMYYTSHSSISEQEILLRLLAKENRFHRRILSEALYSLINSASNSELTTRYIEPISSGMNCYVFMVFPHFEKLTYNQYREERKRVLHERCYIAKLRFPDIQHVVGIATESNLLGKEGRSEDVIYIDLTQWTSEDDIQVKEIDGERRLTKNLEIFCLHHDEYPNS